MCLHRDSRNETSPSCPSVAPLLKVQPVSFGPNCTTAHAHVKLKIVFINQVQREGQWKQLCFLRVSSLCNVEGRELTVPSSLLGFILIRFEFFSPVILKVPRVI